MKKNVENPVSSPNKILDEISKIVIGKQDIKEMLIVALLSERHVTR
jgi:MoxR-like ATPase